MTAQICEGDERGKLDNGLACQWVQKEQTLNTHLQNQYTLFSSCQVSFTLTTVLSLNEKDLDVASSTYLRVSIQSQPFETEKKKKLGIATRPPVLPAPAR